VGEAKARRDSGVVSLPIVADLGSWAAAMTATFLVCCILAHSRHPISFLAMSVRDMFLCSSTQLSNRSIKMSSFDLANAKTDPRRSGRSRSRQTFYPLSALQAKTDRTFEVVLGAPSVNIV